jgi:hypothetical protein
MPSSRIFVSYVCLGDEPGARTGKQLLNDIRATKTEAVADHETISDERYMPFLMRELPQCGCLIVVQTPAALQSWRVQQALAMAAQHRMQMMRVIAAPSLSASEQPLWATLTTFDASIDYPRVREQILLALALTYFDTGDSFVFDPPIPSDPGLPEPIGRYPSSHPTGSDLAGSNRSVLPSGRSPQPSTPLAVFNRTSAASGAGGASDTPAPRIDSAWSPARRSTKQSGSVLSQIWSLVRAFFVQLWTLPGEADETITLRSDQPQPLAPTRQLVIRRAIVIGVLLILMLGVTLLAVLGYNHLHHS